MKHFFYLLFIPVFMYGCSGEEGVNGQSSAHDTFFSNLSEQCGFMYSGSSTFPEDEEHPLVGTELRIEINDCSDTHVRMELIRDGDYWHGAWVVEKRDEGLHLYHDHLGDVRTTDDLGDEDYHGYGGYADDSGGPLVQYFPADEVTAEMIPAAATNVWMISILPDENQLIYYLERNEIPRFRAVFEKNG